MKKDIPASQLKARCGEILDQVERNKHSVVVTRRGKPIARLVPYEIGAPAGLFGALQGSVQFRGDVIAPIDVDWEASR